MDKNIFGIKVKCIREYREFSQSQLSEMVDIADNTLLSVETKKFSAHQHNFIFM